MKENRTKMITAVNDWQQSGMSVDQYCQLHNLNRSGFYYWRKKILEPLEVSKSASFQLIDIPITSGAVEYIHPAGHKIIFHQQVDANFLKNLLA
jgi:hypothetical protein